MAAPSPNVFEGWCDGRANLQRSKSGADDVVAAIEKAGAPALAIDADLVDPATVPAFVQKLDERSPATDEALDILVNNARDSGWVGFKRRDARQFGHPSLRSTPARPSSSVRPLLDRLRRWRTHHQHLFRCRHEARDSRVRLLIAKAAINSLTHALVSELGPREDRERRSAGLHANGRERRLPRESRNS